MSDRRRRMLPRRTVAGTFYVLAMVLVAATAAWPIYHTIDYVIVVVVAVVLGGGIAAASAHWRWPTWMTALAAAAAVLVAGVGLAVPARRGDIVQVPQSILDVVTGAVTGWKDLLTVELPVGSYRNLMVPALVVFLVGTLVALRLSWRPARIAIFGAATALAMVFFGLAFGRAATSSALVLGPLVIPAPVEMLTGALGLLLSLSWLSWLALDERRQALQRAANTSGVRVSRRRSASDTRRGVLAATMLAIAVLIAGVAAPAIAASQPRTVLRSAVGPDIDLARAQTPLTTYRSDFSDPRYGQVLFRVEALDGTLPDRIRIATLTSYDGETYRALNASSSLADTRFVRVPSALDPGPGARRTLQFTVDSLRGIWLPTFGRVEQVSFAGRDAARLSDGFYYNSSSSAGVETSGGGVAAGDTYTVTAVTSAEPELSSLSAPGTSATTVAAPDSLVNWVQQQDVGSDGTALAELISRLRDRGYLSHALDIAADAPPTWVTALGGYTFQPSASGHSLARIDTMFRQLIERQTEVEAAGGKGSLVAAIGDDEQFAVAGALVAQQLGFPARVVLGARLASSDTGVTRCVDGVCRAGDLTAWIEVQSSKGQWVAIDVTPQHTASVDAEVRRQRDPRNPTDVRPETAKEVVPPNPVQQDTADDASNEATPLDLTALWTGVRVGAGGALVLALVLGPFLVIVAAKSLRRRSRREDADAAARVVGGWEEYVDAAADHGLPVPRTLTRVEVAASHARPSAVGLAETADRAVFSDIALSSSDAEEFWRIVEAERRGLGEGRSLWQRLIAAVSLKSFTRSLAPRVGRTRTTTAQRTERRMRQPRGGAQSHE